MHGRFSLQEQNSSSGTIRIKGRTQIPLSEAADYEGGGSLSYALIANIFYSNQAADHVKQQSLAVRNFLAVNLVGYLVRPEPN